MAGGADDDDGMISGINVTPLVDITLVLLIIMMVTARIIVSQSVPMDLPKMASGKQVQLQFRVDISKSGETLVDGAKVAGEVFVDGKRVEDIKQVRALAREALAKTPELRAVISADKAVQHGLVLRAMDELKLASVNKIAFGVAPRSPDAPAPEAEPAKAP